MTEPSKSTKFPVRELVDRLEDEHGSSRMIARFDPMEELVSCILSQHTSDANSFPTFTHLRETYPDWQAIVDAGVTEVAQVIKRAGLANQKAKSIVGSLQMIKDRTGAFDLESLRSMSMLEARAWLTELPGVGPKTASIVLCFAMGMPAIPVDTHVYRVSWRLGVIPEVGENAAHDLLLDRVPNDLAYRYHAVLIQHGRTICKAPLPICDACPVTDLCQWFKSGGPYRRQAELKAARTKRA